MLASFLAGLFFAASVRPNAISSVQDECAACEKILLMCSPACQPDETCVVTRQTCKQCGTPYCIPNDKLSAFCDSHPIAICQDSKMHPGFCALNCKKSRL